MPLSAHTVNTVTIYLTVCLLPRCIVTFFGPCDPNPTYSVDFWPVKFITVATFETTVCMATSKWHTWMRISSFSFLFTAGDQRLAGIVVRRAVSVFAGISPSVRSRPSGVLRWQEATVCEV